jgi:hypothetical protein
MIYVISGLATEEQVQQMLEMLQTYIKLAVDIRRRVLAGGGALHADCEAALLEDGSQQADVWGADWVPDTQEVRYESLINIRPKQKNRSIRIADPKLCAQIEAIVRARFTTR